MSEYADTRRTYRITSCDGKHAIELTTYSADIAAEKFYWWQRDLRGGPPPHDVRLISKGKTPKCYQMFVNDKPKGKAVFVEEIKS